VALQLATTPPWSPQVDTMVLNSADVARRGAQAAVEWYSQRGLEWIQDAAPALWRRLAPGGPVPPLAVRDLGMRREGLYEEKRDLATLHWRVFQLDVPWLSRLQSVALPFGWTLPAPIPSWAVLKRRTEPYVSRIRRHQRMFVGRLCSNCLRT
jgi:hypothetical protein